MVESIFRKCICCIVILLFSCDKYNQGEIVDEQLNVEENIYVGDVVVKTQAELDTYTELLNYNVIQGNVYLGGVTSLEVFSKIFKIDGTVNIGWEDEEDYEIWYGSNDLMSLEGFDSLKEITGSLNINGFYGLDSLEDISALSSLEKLRNLYIGRVDFITELSVFSNLKVISSLRLRLNNLETLKGFSNISGSCHLEFSETSLNNLEGLESITTLSSLSVIGNSELASLKGLENVIESKGSLSISKNDKLTSIDALSSMSNVDGSIFISGNDLLENVDGLSGLSSVKGSLIITYVSSDKIKSMSDLSGIRNITSVGGSFELKLLNAVDNLDPICNLTSVGGDLWVISNTSLDKESDFSGLSNVVVTDMYTISGNGYNPTQLEIAGLSCSN